MKRHFLQLAHTYTEGISIGGYYCSEKLDGMRAFWDGGITRGLPCSSVAFANTEKDGRYVTAPKSTGLWSRYGKAIQAPDWFLDSLPKIPLDGELYAGRGNFQSLMSTVKDLNPGPGWRNVTYMTFDTPPYHVVFGDGEINETNFKKKFVGLRAKLNWPSTSLSGAPQFRQVYHYLFELEENNVFKVHMQYELPPMTVDAVKLMNEYLDHVISEGGEGLILRHPTAGWIPGRVRTCLKVKAMLDAEGTVMGYVWGRETTLGSKLLGLMGALVLDFNGKRLELSGFTEAERIMRRVNGTQVASLDAAYVEGCRNPGKEVREDFYNPTFPRGSKVTFKYRELTDDKIPKEARYWRKRESNLD